MESSSCSLHQLLLCDEELHSSPSPTPSPSPTALAQRGQYCCCASESPLCRVDEASEEEYDSAFQDYLSRENIYVPVFGYLEHLHRSFDLRNSRFRAVRWILLAHGRLNLALGTAFNAVNYLDRFISIYCCIKWETWLVELLAIACLSIASKLDEVFVPSLHDFQTEDLNHSFQPSTIQRMELAVLHALDWRLTCVTSYSYVDLLTWHLDSLHGPVTARITELLLRALLDTRFIEFSASTISLSALRCGLEELVPPKSEAHLSTLSRHISSEHMAEIDKCRRRMEEDIVGPLGGLMGMEKKYYNYPSSPVTVIPMQRMERVDCHVNIENLFHPNLKKRKRKVDESLYKS